MTERDNNMCYADSFLHEITVGEVVKIAVFPKA
jgi:hypothetical protein